MFDEMHEQVKSMVLTEEEQDYLAWIKMKGVTQGADQRTREMAKRMLAEGDSVEKVVRISELSEADVLAIKAEIEK